MIVEFIGCTGAGKTTLIAEMRKQLSRHAEVKSSFEVVAAPFGLGKVTHPTLQNLIQEAVCAPFFVGGLAKHASFLGFVLQMLRRQGQFTFFSFNYLRSLERTLGVDSFLKLVSRKAERFVFVDEGTIVPAHNIFVYNHVNYSSSEILRYGELAPLPDVVVYVRAPIESLIQRTLQRTDPPREMRGQSPAIIENFVRRADAMFEQLVQAERIQPRLLRVDNPEAGKETYTTLAQQVTERLLSWTKTKQTNQ